MTTDCATFVLMEPRKGPVLLYRKDCHGWRYCEIGKAKKFWAIPGKVHHVPAEPPAEYARHDLQADLHAVEAVAWIREKQGR
jgi:hypothetical protein